MAGSVLWNVEAVAGVLNRSSGSALEGAATVLATGLLGACPPGGYAREPHEGRQEQAVAAGALEALLAAMAREPEHAGAQYALIAALGNLTGGQPTFRARAVKGGALPLVVQALRKHRTLAEPCCNTLYALMAHSEANSLAAASLGAIEAVVDAMRAEAGNAGLQSAGFRALYNMSCGRNPADPNRRRVVAAKAVERAVAALALHRDAADVVFWIAEFLSVLCKPGELEAGVCMQDSAMVRATTTGAVAALLLPARLHAAEARVQEAVAGAFLRMAETPDAEARGDAIEWLVAMSRQHAANAQLLNHVFSAVAMMSSQCLPDARASSAARSAGLAESVALALRTHAGQGNCIMSACAALHKVLEADEEGCGAEAVACGLPALLPQAQRTPLPPSWGVVDASAFCNEIGPALQRAEQRHDMLPCTRTERCARCKAARKEGAMCGLPTCGLRTRDGGGKLQRCKGCLSVVFCSAEHQREMWPQHKAACKAAQAARTAAA